MVTYAFDSEIIDVVPENVIPFKGMSHISKTPIPWETRSSEIWRASCLHYIQKYIAKNKPCLISSRSNDRVPVYPEVVLPLDITPATITVYKLLTQKSQKIVSYPIDQIYGIEDLRANEISKARDAMKAAGYESSAFLNEETDVEKNNREKGLNYELYLGLVLEKKGYSVAYNGIEKGKLDNGIDIVAIDHLNKEIYLIQAKDRIQNLSSEEILRMSRSFEAYIKANQIGYKYIQLFVHTHELNVVVLDALRLHSIEAIKVEHPKSFPKIKCIIGDCVRRAIYPAEKDYYSLQLCDYSGFLVSSTKEAMEHLNQGD